MRITAQLINVEDGYHLWSDTFDRDLDDIFAIQEEIATRVVKALTLTILGESSGPLVHVGTSNTQAYEAYLRGRYLFWRNPDDIQVLNEVEKLYLRAIELDPQFTLAWYGQYFVLSRRHRSGNIDYQEGAVQLRELADKMVIMDPGLAESYVALGRTTLVEMKWAESEAAYRQALQLNPGNIDAIVSLSGLMTLLKRNDEALELALKALARDPLDLQALTGALNAYSLLGQCTEAVEISNRALSLAPEAGRFHGSVGDCWLLSHDEYSQAKELYKKEPLGFIRQTGLAITYNKLGQYDKAQQSLDALIEKDGEGASYQYGQIYAQWGEPEKALAALERAWEIGDPGLLLMYADKHLDPIRDQPRFIALLEKWQNPSSR